MGKCGSNETTWEMISRIQMIIDGGRSGEEKLLVWIYFQG